MEITVSLDRSRSLNKAPYFLPNRNNAVNERKVIRMFGWKEYLFGEEATDDNLNGHGVVWNLFREWRPFIRYQKRTDILRNKGTGKPVATVDYFRCPEWVGEAIKKQLMLRKPGKLLKCNYNSETGKITVDK